MTEENLVEDRMEKCKKHIENVEADFVDIRYEIKKETNIGFDSADIKEVSGNTTDGYVVRVMDNGGFGVSTVSRAEDIPWAIEKAKDAAKVISSTTKAVMADAPVVKDIITVELEMDPRTTSLEEKLEITKKYNDIMLGEPEISSTPATFSCRASTHSSRK